MSELNRVSDIENEQKISHLSDIANQQKISHLSDIANEQKVSHLSDIANKQKISHLSDIASQQKISHLSDIASQQKISHLSDTANQQKISNMSNIGNEQKISHLSDTANQQKISNMSNIGNEQKISHLPDIANQQKISHFSDIANQQKISNMSNIVNEQKISHLSDIANEQKISHLSDIANEQKISHFSDIANQQKISNLSNPRQTNRDTSIPEADINETPNIVFDEENSRQSTPIEIVDESQPGTVFHGRQSTRVQADPSRLSAEGHPSQYYGGPEELPRIPSTHSRGIQMTNLQEHQMHPGYGVDMKNASVSAPDPNLWNPDRNASLRNTNMSYGKDSDLYRPPMPNQSIGSMKIFDVPESFSYISQGLALGDRAPRDTNEIRFFKPSDATPSTKNVLRVVFNNVPESYRKIGSPTRDPSQTFDQKNFESFNIKNSIQGDGNEGIEELRRGSQARNSRATSQAENNLYEYIERRISTLAANSKIEVQHLNNAESTRKKTKSIFQHLPNLSELGMDGSGNINIHFGAKDSAKRSDYIKMYRPTKNLTLPQLKDFTEEFYDAKRVYDARCAKMETPRVTAEEFLCIYLKQKYGLNELVQEWAFTIVASMKQYANKDVDVSIFFHVG